MTDLDKERLSIFLKTCKTPVAFMHPDNKVNFQQLESIIEVRTSGWLPIDKFFLCDKGAITHQFNLNDFSCQQ